jgi:hypothetical protein
MLGDAVIYESWEPPESFNILQHGKKFTMVWQD